MHLTYPSAEFPAPPSISIDLPPGWTPTIVAGSLFAATKASEAGRFAANIICTWVRHDGDGDLDGIIAALEAELAGQPDAHLFEPVTTDLDGTLGIGRAAVFVDPSAGSVAQFHLLVQSPHGGCLDVLHLTSTVGGDRVEEDFPEICDMFRSVRLTADGSSGASGT